MAGNRRRTERDEACPRKAGGGASTRVHGLMQRWHRGEEGAVAIAALAACILLLMMVASLWDVGQTVRAKTKLQTATDAAAYSKAAVEARTMNYMSFANVAKRTVIGTHNSYHSYVAAWDTATSIRCLMAACCFALQPYCCDYCALSDCLVSGAYYLLEQPDYAAFSGQPMVMGSVATTFTVGAPLSGTSKRKFGNEVATLQTFQDYMVEITPWWSYVAGALRGPRNGATATATWPLPPTGDQSTFGINYGNFKQVMNGLSTVANMVSGGNSVIPNTAVPVVADSVPVEQGGQNEGCSFPLSGPVTAGQGLELVGNYVLNYMRSDSTRACTNWADASGPAVAIGALALNTVACEHTKRRHDKFRNNMAPMRLTASMDSSKSGELARSSIAIGYRHLQRAGHEKYAFNPEYESRNTWSSSAIPGIGSLPGFNTGDANYEPNGVWTLARAEFTSPKALPSLGGNGAWMWHTGWTARMRPLSYEGELDIQLTALDGYIDGGTSFGQGEVKMETIFQDVALVMFLQAQAFAGLQNLDVDDFGEITRDFGYMLEKGSKSMDNDRVHNVPK